MNVNLIEAYLNKAHYKNEGQSDRGIRKQNTL